MSEPADQSAQTAETESTPTEPTYTPPATQAELDRIISERVKRTKAQFQDYNDLKAAKAELDKIKAENQTEAQRLAEETARWQSEAETWRKTAVGSRIEALASSDFADPSDAVAAIGDPSRFLDAGGQIDNEAIRAELADVLERKPHWRKADAAPAGPRPPAPNPAQGTGGSAAATDPAAQFASIVQGQLNRP